MVELIGPLTAEEWCSLRLGTDDDPLQCCGATSNLRDGLFRVLRMGGDAMWAPELAEAWRAMDDHGWPEGVPVVDKIRAFYGDRVAQCAVVTDDDVDTWMRRELIRTVLCAAAERVEAAGQPASAVDLRRWGDEAAEGQWPTRSAGTEALWAIM